MIGAVAIAVITAAAALARNRSEGIGYAVGTVIGALALMAIVGGLLWKFRSARAGLVATMVAGGLATAANVAQLDDGSSTDRQIQQAIDDLGLATNGEEFRLTDAEADCLDQSGFEPEDLLTALTDTGAAGAQNQLTFIDVMARCAPRALLTDGNVEQYRVGFSANLDGEITTDEARCMLQGIADAQTPSAVATGADAEGFAEVAGACLSAETLAVVRNEPGTGPQIIGDDISFDRLAERCLDGSDPACDLLFGRAAEDSEYAVLAEDCAGRGLDSVSICTSGFVDTDSNGFMDDDSPGWPALFTACRQGDMLACDFIYFWAELGSEGERIGETCGERRAVAADATCISLYGEQATE